VLVLRCSLALSFHCCFGSIGVYYSTKKNFLQYCTYGLQIDLWKGLRRPVCGMSEFLSHEPVLHG
jgi:hypothetical protein